MKSPIKNATTKPIIESINENEVVFSKKLDLKISFIVMVNYSLSVNSAGCVF